MIPDLKFVRGAEGMIFVDASTPFRLQMHVGRFDEAPAYHDMTDFTCVICRSTLQDHEDVIYHAHEEAIVFHVKCIEQLLEQLDPSWLDERFEKLRTALVEKYEENPLAKPAE